MSLKSVPRQFLRAGEAPPRRTLVDILSRTAAAHPNAAAIDDGEVLTYAELMDVVRRKAADLHAAGIRRGDRIGVRLPSGGSELYTTILAVLTAGAAYVPVDADDPDERAEMVFGEARVNATVTDAGLTVHRRTAGGDTRPPRPDDDAWIIFTSGSTGRPKGVAVTHRSAAAFVDAEARMFLADAPGGPLGPDDRVLAGLSVAFDASCEEMWLAWGHGACLVPAPRMLVRSGMDLGPWLISHDITVVSTVPTLAGLWPPEALDNVRLLIFGGEACPAELVQRLDTGDREIWNTYGPTEATVVACAARLHADRDVSIGLPLDGWDLVVVDADGAPVAPGQVGELVIGGVGLARYLDPEKEREKYAPLRSVGWSRAYRSGDHVRLEEDGLYFVGRVDDQVKIGGRRIELGEVEAAVAALPGVRSSAVVVQTTGADSKVLVAYLSREDDAVDFDTETATARLAEGMPAALVPRLCVLDELPVRTSGKVDKAALPWPLPGAVTDTSAMTPTEAWLAELWVDVLGAAVADPDADFFALGGTSLAAATLVGRIRERFPTISVRELYDHPRLGALAHRLDERPDNDSGVAGKQPAHPVPARTRVLQHLIQVPVMTLQAAQWVAWLLVGNNLAAAAGAWWAKPAPWWLVLLLLTVFVTPVGRLPMGAFAARLLTRGIVPGNYARGGRKHLRLWTADRIQDACGARDIAGATWITSYARLLGATVGRDVHLHTLPPVTGLLTLGDHCCIEPETDLSGMWVDGDTVHVGRITVEADARVGARSTLLPGAVIGAGAHVESGSCVTGDKKVKAGARWAGSPAAKVGRAKQRFPEEHPDRRPWWVPVYGATSLALSLMPVLSVGAGAAVVAWLATILGSSTTSTVAAGVILAPLGALIAFGLIVVLTLVGVRLMSIRLDTGVHPVRSRIGWQLWATERLMDAARTHLFPLYASRLTPAWLRALGASVGRDTEISTAVLVPAFTEIRDGAFLADDTMVGGYELGGGWMLAGRTRIGKRSFLGNSGIAGAGRKLAKNSLVAVLSQTPKKARAGSNWLGSPPERLRRVTVDAGGEARTYQPTARLKRARGLVETMRLLAPMTSGVLAAGTLLALQWLYTQPDAPFAGAALAWLCGGLVLMAAGLGAAAITVAVKWLCVGRIRPSEHPLWSRFVWLNELQDAFVEAVAAPWFLNPNQGAQPLVWFLRAIGARIGRGTWIESYWLPEADLVEVGDGATIGPGCVVQTHLFQDRVMSLDTVWIGPGAVLGPHSVILPAASLGEGTTIGPASLVLRGDRVPGHTVWHGNPVEPRG
ncbi:Pls/PosA family non-ribosomal peptide synthetase [Corynebacterium antarcticum]|uniref:Pls/PosA family non-ribosomal peptide synthetase n=1 Tax=Corynebacterium antarcticum TaxID=2800405 RepID=UPI002260A8AE|nr:Pls/PosA family non-ribosomal peptide synthetase [Corynebacterium antarcticum]MCX7541195.1 amino acid adenylation domain-containing protein [Corynebacterium antarcticum]